MAVGCRQVCNICVLVWGQPEAHREGTHSPFCTEDREMTQLHFSEKNVSRFTYQSSPSPNFLLWIFLQTSILFFVIHIIIKQLQDKLFITLAHLGGEENDPCLYKVSNYNVRNSDMLNTELNIILQCTVNLKRFLCDEFKKSCRTSESYCLTK